MTTFNSTKPDHASFNYYSSDVNYRWILALSALSILVLILLVIVIYHVTKIVRQKRRVRKAKSSGANAFVTIEPFKKIFLVGDITEVSLENDENTCLPQVNSAPGTIAELDGERNDGNLTKLTFTCFKKNIV